MFTIIAVILNIKFVKDMPLYFIYVNGGFKEWGAKYTDVAFSRFIMYLTGLLLSVTVLRLASKNKVKILTKVGENSLSIYILHTVILQIIRNLRNDRILNIPLEYDLYFIIITFILVMVITSNKYVTGLFNKYAALIKNVSEKINNKLIRIEE